MALQTTHGYEYDEIKHKMSKPKIDFSNLIMSVRFNIHQDVKTGSILELNQRKVTGITYNNKFLNRKVPYPLISSSTRALFFWWESRGAYKSTMLDIWDK